MSQLTPDVQIGGGKRMYREVWGGVAGGKRSKSPKVQGFQGPGVPRSQGPRYLKLTFKYELDSKEGPSCFRVAFTTENHSQTRGVFLDAPALREGFQKNQKKTVVILLQPPSIYLPTLIGVQKATFLFFFGYFEMMFKPLLESEFFW